MTERTDVGRWYDEHDEKSRSNRGCYLIIAVTILAAVAYRGGQSLSHVPTRGAMLSSFGRQVHYQDCGFHTGQDWFAPSGTSVFAVADGEVLYVGPLWKSGPGVGRGDYAVVLDHGDYITTYSHNRAALVAVGETVERGQVIAEVGSEGYSGGPHLHFEKVVSPFTGDWRQPFEGCDAYVDPGLAWSPY